MASFVIHLTAGVKFLEALEKRNNIILSEEDKRSFILGNLIVDSIREKDKSKVQEEKVKTHFRDTSKLEHVTQYPDLSLFLKKYGKLVESNYTVLGYFFHLFTDYMFFTFLFDKTLEYLDEDGNVTILLDRVKNVHIKKNGSIVSLDEFFNGNVSGMYHDYTIMNKIVLETYTIDVDIQELTRWAKNNFHNPGIKEVDYFRIESVLNSLDEFINSSYLIEEQKLDVFVKEDIIDFIRVVIDVFMKSYYKDDNHELSLKYED